MARSSTLQRWRFILLNSCQIIGFYSQVIYIFLQSPTQLSAKGIPNLVLNIFAQILEELFE